MFLTSRQRRAFAQKEASQPPKPAIPVPEPFLPQLATVAPDSPVATGAALDRLPTSIRQQIFRFAELDYQAEGGKWQVKLRTRYDQLKLVSRQFYHDLQDMHWQATLVRRNQLDRLLTFPFFANGLTKPDRDSPLYKKLNSLTLEIPLNASSKCLKRLSLALLSLPLKELKLFFVGSDAWNVKTGLKSCILRQSATGHLRSDGQCFRRRALFINTLSRLQNLETLVLDNANLPVVYSQVVMNKPRLQKLSITADPRSAINDQWSIALNDHTDADLQRAVYGVNATLEKDMDNFAPLDELEISANSMLLASRLVLHAVLTVKKLTWMVPNRANQTCDSWQKTWFSQSAEILLCAAMNGWRIGLETVRICIDEPILEPRLGAEDHDQVGSFMYNLLHLRQITSLRSLELHLDMQQTYRKHAFDVVSAVGDDLERLYVSERMFKANYNHSYLIHRLLEDNFRWRAFEIPASYCGPWAVDILDDSMLYSRIEARKNLIFFGYEFTADDGTVLRVVEVDENVPKTHYESSLMLADLVIDQDLEVEDLRMDGPWEESYIQQARATRQILDARAAHLAQIDASSKERIAEEGYMIDWEHFAGEEEICEIESDLEMAQDNEISSGTSFNTIIELLRFNGRLLDRERNKHLTCRQNDSPQIAPEEEKPVAVGERPVRRFPVVVLAKDDSHWMCK